MNKGIGGEPDVDSEVSKEITESIDFPGMASTVLGHPTRVRILEVVNELDMSPIKFLNSGLAREEVFEGRDNDAALSHVAYHFRALKKFGCVVIVDSHQRRGATEHVYRGVARAFFSDEEWAELPAHLRPRISRTMLSGLIARAEGAILAGTFDSRLDRHLSWLPLEVDEVGWGALKDKLAGTLEDVRTIRDESLERIAKSGETPIRVTVGILGFESPPPSILFFSGGGEVPDEPPPLYYGDFYDKPPG